MAKPIRFSSAFWLSRPHRDAIHTSLAVLLFWMPGATLVAGGPGFDMNAEFAALLEVVPLADQEELRASHTRWEAYREDHCAAESSLTIAAAGSLASTSADRARRSCATRLDGERARQLRALRLVALAKLEDSGGGTAPRFDQTLVRASGPRESITAIAISADGTTIITGHESGAIHVRSGDGVPSRTLGAYRSPVRALNLTPNGRLLVGLSESEPDINIWDSRTGQQLYVLKSENAHAVAISPTARLLAYTDSSTLKLFQMNVGEESGIEYYTRGAIQSLAFSPSGKYLVAGTATGNLHVWKVVRIADRGATRLAYLAESKPFKSNNRVMSIQFSEDDSTFWTAARHGNIDEWSLNLESQRQADVGVKLVGTYYLLPGGERAVVAGLGPAGTGVVTIVDLVAGARNAMTLPTGSSALAIPYANGGAILIGDTLTAHAVELPGGG